jgi:hypothetical protein
VRKPSAMNPCSCSQLSLVEGSGGNVTVGFNSFTPTHSSSNAPCFCNDVSLRFHSKARKKSNPRLRLSYRFQLQSVKYPSYLNLICLVYPWLEGTIIKKVYSPNTASVCCWEML